MGRGRKLTSKDAEIIKATLKVLNGEYGEEARRIMRVGLKMVAEQIRLDPKGLKVRVPRLRIGRPQLLLVQRKGTD